jgi:signal transduction histidine kinase
MRSGFLEPLRPAFAFRLALWYAGLFTLSALALFGLTYHLLQRSLEGGDHELVRSTLAEYSSQYEAGGLPALRRSLEARQAVGGGSDLYVRILGAGRETVFLSLPRGWAELASFPFDPAGGAGVLEWSAVPGRSADALLEVASLRLADGTLFQVGRSSEHRVEVLRRFRGVLTGMLALVLLAGLTGGLAFTHSALQPLRELTRVVAAIVETGRLSERVPVSGSSDPLDALGRLLNSMLGRIEALVVSMRESLDNVAHDLRTPLARLQMILDDALQRPDPAHARDSIADALEETERVTGTLNALLDLSEAEAGAMRLQVESVPASSLLSDVEELYADLAEEKGVALECRCPEGLAVSGDRRRLRQAFANLLDNAIKYTPSGGRVTIEARSEGERAVVSVSDTGPGIPLEEQARIWERLYRSDASRSERGLGLGLSLVRAIVHAHGGSVELESAPGEGARFTVRLPPALPA